MSREIVRCLAVLACVAIASPAESRAASGTARVEAAFTPGDDISALIVRRVARSRYSVQVQAYLFTDRKLANALVAARRRGVEVEVIGDAAQQESGGLPWLGALERAGASVFLNTSHAASHNKIVIVDGRHPAATVITGSYNFTLAAQSRNAENVVVISGNRRVTDRFVENFEFHRGQSIPWH
ncbi:MAG TPA: phospholipase D-like domain-containing protein [Usitatibacter sp.]|jgi:phosphatidylserine/phosphatidylglycerophosphate/cardiolipin synthase-like enzyme